MMKCLLCGRMLKNEKSREYGYGPICYQRAYGHKGRRASKKIHNVNDGPMYDIPGQMTVFDFLDK